MTTQHKLCAILNALEGSDEHSEPPDAEQQDKPAKQADDEASAASAYRWSFDPGICG